MLKLLLAAWLAITSRGSLEALHESTCTVASSNFAALDVKHNFAALIQHQTSLGRSGKLVTRRLYAEWDPDGFTSNGTSPINASASLLWGASPIPINASNALVMPGVRDAALPNSSIPRTLANESARTLINISGSMDAIDLAAGVSGINKPIPETIGNASGRNFVNTNATDTTLINISGSMDAADLAAGASDINKSIPETVGNASGRHFVDTNATDTDASAANESEGTQSSNNASSSEDSSSDAESEEAKAKRRKRNMMIFGGSTALPILCLLFGGSTFGNNHADATGDDSDDYWGAQKNVGM